MKNHKFHLYETPLCQNRVLDKLYVNVSSTPSSGSDGTATIIASGSVMIWKYFPNL